MDPQLLLNKPKPISRVNPTITRVSALVLVSEESKKSSAKLKKIFETRTYQKKTQVTVLDRYKRKLDSLNKTNEKRFLRKKQTKLNPPEIKKYVGEFFSPGGDALKTFAGLSALGAFQNFKKGDWAKGIGSTLLTVGALGGLGLGGLSMLSGRVPGGGGTPGGIKPVPKPLSSGSLSRVNASQARFIQGNANIGDRARLIRRGWISPAGAFSRGGVEQTAKYGGDFSKLGKAFGRFGKSIVPIAGAALGAVDAGLRTSEGDYTGAAIAGTSASLDALAAASAATGIGLPVAGLLSIASFGLDVVNLVRDLSGASEREAAKNKPQQDKLKKQTEEQKKLVEKKKESRGGLTFRKTLDRYEKCVDKFQQFVKGFKGGMGMAGEQSGVIETGNRALETGENLQDLEATGGEVPGAPNSRFGRRGGRQHKGNDYNRPVGTPISIIQPGVVTVADMNYEPSGWGAVVEIRHENGALSRYAHLSEINVAAGTQVTPGQVIGKVGGAKGAPGSGNSTGPHLHFEYENGSGRIDPTAVAPKIFRFGGNVKVKQSQSPQRQPRPDGGQPTGQSAAAAAERQQTFQTLGSSIVDETITVDPKDNIISQTTRPLYQPQVINVPYPVITKQSSSNVFGGGGIMISGIHEEQALNTYYKKILLNTIA